ncbi:methanol/ethanol family PQQ-dependent dehydrogenase [Sphingomonas sp. BN140010]|uniref:Methanol/ethanol family PQQ-dependent dehydrogenase n=1 Tax=Sphingomonas arvum TaxID=2992113 RepID=A0ABT3JHG7_9SPHN|nr:methanol/ethanol family PQQ-dependent dehydrogenase [Sphingomonas sp. BN140010]MCW3798436.1 methanol/ethanol family PQQ-dependent dehydrogenase [Sphingomonas sp. BN140010]
MAGAVRWRLAALFICTLLATPAFAQTGAVTARSVAQADNGNWEMPGKNVAATRFSAMREITPANVRNLRVAFTASTGINRGHEAPPLVIGGTMYLVTPFPNKLIALDLTKPGAPTKWVFNPKPPTAAQGVACCDVVNRGAVYANGRLFFNTLDGRTVAVDARSGKLAWQTKLGDIQRGETMTMAPTVANGKVIVGNSGGEMGVRGWIAALDTGSGRVVWKAFNTGPDKDVLIGPRFRPFYAMDRGKDLGVKTWPPGAWKIGGGSVWGWVSYDPQLRLIYYGTGNPGPWNPEQRPGDNKWTTGVFARDVDTGQAVWFYQSTPHDLYDHDDINEIILVDMPVAKRMRPVLLRPARNGFFYVHDRRTGQLLSAKPYSYMNVAKGIDPHTGRLIPVPEKEPKVGRVVRNICPAAPGAKDWNPAAFSPITGVVYIPHINLCMDMGALEANYIAGTPYVGADVKMYAGPGGNRGVFTAWDPVHARKVWEFKEDLPLWSPALATAGGLVFYGTMDGWFKAIDQRNGKLVWQFKTGSGIIGQPISYRGPDGHQYVAVMSGVGGWAGAIVAGKLDPRDGTAALGFVNAMKDLPARTDAGGMLYVFTLPR